MTKLNKTLLFLNFTFIAAIITVGAVLAWTGPASSPPSGSGLLSYANSNVGIGTANPGYKLDVQGGQINASGGLCMSGDCKITWPAGGGGGSGLWATSGTAIYNTNSGNVGIGTDSPNAKLRVEGDIWINPGSSLILGDPTTNYQSITGDTNGNDLVYNTWRDHIFRQGGVNDVMVIKDSGNIGIGITDPGQKLTVAGTIESTTGGFKFPDGATQTAAVTGTWTSVPFNAGDFTGSGSMTWTVEAGDVLNYSYTIIGKTMFLSWYINSTTLSGTASDVLNIKIPAGKIPSRTMIGTGLVFSTSWFPARVTAISSTANIQITKADGSPFTTGANNQLQWGSIYFEIQ